MLAIVSQRDVGTTVFVRLPSGRTILPDLKTA
jgi:hypothetical protein